MKASTLYSRLLMVLVLLGLLAGCLEVDQHPPWREGAYRGKRDDRAANSHYAADRLSWNAAISNRNELQNEYRRMP